MDAFFRHRGIEDGIELKELNDRLFEWIDNQYNVSIHSSTKETPFQRYIKDAPLLRPAPEGLRDYFRKRALRKVDKDRTVTIMGRVYEAPVELIGKTITLLYHEDEPLRVEAFYDGKSYGILGVLNPHINCRIKRHQGITEIVPEDNLPITVSIHREPVEPIKGGRLFDTGGDDNE